MNILLGTDVRLMALSGKYYLYSAFGSILSRYAEHFGRITLVCRGVEIEKTEKGHIDVSHYIKKAILVKDLKECCSPGFCKRLNEEIQKSDLVIVRAPSIISIIASKAARKNNVPYLAEAMGDAWDANWNHSFLGKTIAPLMLLEMKRVFARANYGLYVTSKFLQRRYPCKGITEGISNVRIKQLSEEVLQKRFHHIENCEKNTVTIMTTAAVNVRFKGQEYMIRALRLLKEKGINAKYLLAGGGDQYYLRHISEQEGVIDSVVFLGHLTTDEVTQYLDKTDIYVQPSLQEGLPRSVIEAMSRGCPCIGAKTAGIPELLEERFVVKRKSINALANAIEFFLALSIDEKKNVAKRNYIETANYIEEKLDNRRREFFEKIVNDIENRSNAGNN